MRTLKTMEPYGLNIADSVQSAHTLFRLFIYYYFQSTITFIVYYFYSFLDLFIYLSIYLLLLLSLLLLSLLLLPLLSYNLLFHGKCLFKVESRGASAKRRLCLNWAIGILDIDIVLASLLLALKVFCAHYGASAVDFEQLNCVLIQFVSSRTFNYYYSR